MNVDRYLNRIGINTVQPTIESLQQLQNNHMSHIPFENLDTTKDIWIPLDLEMIYKKVIENHRGGLCFEINPLFQKLLNNIGFRTMMVTGTVQMSENNWGQENTHLTTLVDINNVLYLTDVGFGNSSRHPIPLTGEPIHDGYNDYRIVHIQKNTYHLQREVNNKWSTQLEFTTEPRTLSFYQPLSEFIQSHPNSPFRRGPFVTMATEKGRTTLTEHSLVITIDGQKKEYAIDTEEFNSLYTTYFK